MQRYGTMEDNLKKQDEEKAEEMPFVKTPFYPVYNLDTLTSKKLEMMARRDAGNKVSVLIRMMMSAYENYRMQQTLFLNHEGRIQNLESAVFESKKEEEPKGVKTLGGSKV